MQLIVKVLLLFGQNSRRIAGKCYKSRLKVHLKLVKIRFNDLVCFCPLRNICNLVYRLLY